MKGCINTNECVDIVHYTGCKESVTEKSLKKNTGEMKTSPLPLLQTAPPPADVTLVW